MIGCFGVAPALGQAISTATSGPIRRQHGLPPLRARRDGPSSRSARKARWRLSRRRPFLPGRRRDRRHRHRDFVRGRVHRAGAQRARRSAGRAARRRNTIFTVGNARPLDQALQHATTEMLRWLGEPTTASTPIARQPPARAMRSLRHRQRLQPRLFRRLPARQGGPCRVRLKVSPSVENVTLPHLVGKVRVARMGCGMSSTGLKYSISGGANAAMFLTARHTPSGLRPPRRSRGRLTLSRPSAYKHHMFSAAAS